jgi:histidinol-phosphatase
MPAYDDDLRLAHVLGDQADSVTMRRYKALDLTVETKPDLTPVTDADKAVEELLRTTLGRSRPRDAIIGEEFGVTGGSGAAVGHRRWVIDPIDGTKNFVRGVPAWATLIALMEDDQVVVGLVSAPSLGRRWWASRGAGAFTGRSLTSATRCHVSHVGSIADASLSYSSILGWEEQGRLDSFLDLARACWRTRAFGDFWSYMLVAEGAIDIAAEPEVSLWDLAAPSLIVEEAGGAFTSLDGRHTPDGGSAAASNGLLHDELLFYLTGH